MAQSDADPGQQFVHPERLGQVVVGAGIEGGDLVVLPPARRDDDDRHAAPAPHFPGHIDAIAVGQPEVKQDHLRVLRRRRDQRLLGRLGLGHPEPLRGERRPEKAAHLRFILDD
jgi:hypothetical protein